MSVGRPLLRARIAELSSLWSAMHLFGFDIHTGNGDGNDNSARYIQYIKQLDHPPISDVNFSKVQRYGGQDENIEHRIFLGISSVLGPFNKIYTYL